MNYIFDTTALVFYIKKESQCQIIEERFEPFSKANLALISIVSRGEMLSLALKNKWGEKRITSLNELLSQFLIIPIQSEDLLTKYAEIDAFSQGRLVSKHSANGTSARNMGKNDLWIAATASITKSTLITADNDFVHLKKIYFDMININQL
jgi:predicted nucleic acid-binding protein